VRYSKAIGSSVLAIWRPYGISCLSKEAMRKKSPLRIGKQLIRPGKVQDIFLNVSESLLRKKDPLFLSPQRFMAMK
jgi:hypothetical protein